MGRIKNYIRRRNSTFWYIVFPMANLLLVVLSIYLENSMCQNLFS